MNTSLWDYYIRDAAEITDHALQGVKTRKDWEKRKLSLRKEFFRSMGLDPMPDKCDLKLGVRGKLKGRGFRIEKLSYQILPDCWASATMYYPDPMPGGKLPAVLFACGHAATGTHGYARYGVMWARRGYACMVFDTIEQNDNPGDHHGLFYGNRPDWVSMGYTAAGGELWNSIRALDVLCALSGVDTGKIGVTGASGGGAHSFYLAIADERIQALGSCCGVTLPKHTLDRQHLLTHCDCMYYHNVFRRDTSEFGALITPRPALFCYGNKDYLFSRDEYTTLVDNMRRVYKLYGRSDDCRLVVYDGPHGYGPECVAAVGKWFDKHLAGGQRPEIKLDDGDALLEKDLSVFNGSPPSPNRLALLPELLRPRGTVELPQNASQWGQIRKKAKAALSDKVFHLMEMDKPRQFEQLGDWLKGPFTYRKYRSKLPGNELWIETYTPERSSGYLCVGVAAEEEQARPVLMRLCASAPGHTLVVIVPRFCGFNHCPTQGTHLLRAGCLTGMPPFNLLLQDIFWCMRSLPALAECKGKKALLYGKGAAGIGALYYSILNDDVAGVVLDTAPASHREGAFALGILPVMDIQHAAGLMAPRKIGFVQSNPPLWARRAYERLGCGDNIVAGASLEFVMEKMA